DRTRETWVRVTEERHPPGRDRIDDALAARRVEPHAFGADDRHGWRLASSLAEGMPDMAPIELEPARPLSVGSRSRRRALVSLLRHVKYSSRSPSGSKLSAARAMGCGPRRPSGSTSPTTFTSPKVSIAARFSGLRGPESTTPAIAMLRARRAESVSKL